MDFLKAILGDELYNTIAEKINAYNGNEANKDKQIKIGNLASGEYVGKGKYDALQELFNGKETELTSANGLIEELKKGTKGNEELQGKIAAYDTQVQQLQAQLKEIKIKSAIKIALLSENAEDVDYLSFKLEQKLKEENKTLELDENDNVKDWKTYSESLKTLYPNQFKGSGAKIIEPQKLPGSGGDKIVTKEDFRKMNYEQRVALKQENEELYKNLTKN